MTWISRLFRKSRMESELESELRFHVENLVADKMREGMTEQESRRAACLELGGIDQIKEECRDVEAHDGWK